MTVTVTDPVPPLCVAVIVAVPVLPARVAEPANGVVMTLVLLELQVAELVTFDPFWVAVNVTGRPPLVVMLMVVPESELTVIPLDVAPTVTVADPLAVPDVAVIVTPPLVPVFASAFISPVLLTLTWLSPPPQVTLLTLPVVPSLKFPVAANCRV